MTQKLRLCFLTCRKMEGWVSDDDLALRELTHRGHSVEVIPWDRAETNWAGFDAVLIRTTWDYTERLTEFLEAMARVRDSGTRLLNPFEIVTWNTNKRYLIELEQAGVPTIPTFFSCGLLEPGLLDRIARWTAREIVVKLLVGAGGRRAVRLPRAELSRASTLAALRQEFASTEVMVQPLLSRIVSEGETSLIFFGGELSHALRKTPKPGEFRCQEEHGGSLTPHSPNARELEVARQVLAIAAGQAKRSGGSSAHELLYARVDLLPGDDGTPTLIELEATEPSLYFRMAPGTAPQRFADALEAVFR